LKPAVSLRQSGSNAMTRLFFAAPAQIENGATALAFAGKRQRPAAILLVAVVHILAVWAIFAGIKPRGAALPVPEFKMTVFRPAVTPPTVPPPPEWKFQQVKDAFLPEPDIQIEPDPDAPSITTTLMSQVLPPRPDPYYINKAPEAPDKLRRDALNAAVTLRILVMPDGSVEQAMLVKGTSNTELDKFTMAFVEANWRFLPATAGGKPIQDWTTVRVRFTS
jgi:periplasmic protein TonB